ncbi:hypothetical protein E3G68_005070 [Mycobacteroides abscessus]|nr:hypothetical protein [Mycobacteroides abscessus]
MNHLPSNQQAPLHGDRGLIHRESHSAATDEVGRDAASISTFVDLIHRESVMGESQESASSSNASGVRGLRDRPRRRIRRESCPTCGGHVIHRESGVGECHENEHSASLWRVPAVRGLRGRSGNLIHRESRHPAIWGIAATAIAPYPRTVAWHSHSGQSIHRESHVLHIHRTAPNDTASAPTRPSTSTLIHRESDHPKGGPTS